MPLKFLASGILMFIDMDYLLLVYKSRPCMVIKANPKPIQRLKDKGFDVYKADIILLRMERYH